MDRISSSALEEEKKYRFNTLQVTLIFLELIEFSGSPKYYPADIYI
jgi:hypothetical protein